MAIPHRFLRRNGGPQSGCGVVLTCVKNLPATEPPPTMIEFSNLSPVARHLEILRILHTIHERVCPAKSQEAMVDTPPGTVAKMPPSNGGAA